MVNRDETGQSVPASTSIRHPRFRQWLVRRARQLLIAVLILAGALVVGACGIMLRRATCLIGLPDVADPFDVAAFRAFRVPEDQDALALMRQAAAKLPPMPDLPIAARRAGSAIAWSQSDPKLREWLEASREPLNLFRRGAERADAMPVPLVKPVWRSISDLSLGRFVWLALLEASRLEAQGEMAAARGWYRSVLRTKVHMTRRGIVFERFIVNRICSGLQPRIANWAADLRTEVSLLRRALNDVCGGEPKAEWDSFSLRLDYLQIMNELDRPDGWVWQGGDEDQSIRIGGEPLPPNLVRSIYATRRFLLNEPERSRRVLRLAFANWLAHAQDAHQANRRPAVRATFRSDKRDTNLFFYAGARSAAAGPRAFSPQDLASWLVTSRDAKLLLFQWPWPSIRNSEQRQHRALVVLLAEELYHRERGSLPASEEALLGTYLDHLPDDGSDELDDGTAQRVEESSVSGLGKSE